MIRMLLVGYIFAIRSERRLCAEIQVNLAYRWFCKLGIEDKIPDHSIFCRARRERFRESDALRRVFEGVVAMSIAAGLVGGEAFSIDASLIKADVDKKKRIRATSRLHGRRQRRHPMRFASISQPSIPPAAMRIAVETTVRAKAASDASLPRKSRSPIRKRHGLRGQAWTPSLPTMQTT
jgi:IS5 family transposase